MLRPLLLFIGLVLLYSAFLTRTYYWDGVLFSLYIEKVYSGELPRSILFHPNHLLYSGFGYLLYCFAREFGLHLRAITLLQCANVLAGAATGALVFALAHGLYGSKRLALFCSLLFAFGATWWKFSTDADSYIVSVLLLLLAVSFAISGKRSLLLVGICHSFAMLFHELAIFAYAPILVAILWKNKPRAACVRHAFLYLLSTAGCVASIYCSAYAFAGRDSGRTFLRWVVSFSSESRMTRSWRQMFLEYPSSYFKLLAGGKLSLVRDFFSPLMAVALVLSGAALLAGILLIRRPQWKGSVSINRRTKVVLWAWVLPYLLFLAWWEPGNAFYKLFIWPPIVLLLGCFMAERSFWISRGTALVTFSTALAAWNFGAFIFPRSHSSADPVLQLAETIDKELPKNATVYYKVLSPDDWYLQYFAPGRRWLPLSINSFTQPTPGPDCIETTALDYLGQSFISTAHRSPRRHWELVNSKHNIRLACIQRPEED